MKTKKCHWRWRSAGAAAAGRSLFARVIFFKSRIYNWTDVSCHLDTKMKERKGRWTSRIETHWSDNKNDTTTLLTSSHSERGTKRPVERLCSVLFAFWNSHGMRILCRCWRNIPLRNSTLGSRWCAAAQILWNFIEFLHPFAASDPHRGRRIVRAFTRHFVEWFEQIRRCGFLIESNCWPYLPLQFIHEINNFIVYKRDDR